MPRDLHQGNVNFDELKIGDKIRVKILKTRFQSHDEFIMAVGTLEDIVAASAPAAPAALPASALAGPAEVIAL
jgi:hypothetical protein